MAVREEDLREAGGELGGVETSAAPVTITQWEGRNAIALPEHQVHEVE